MGLELSEKAKEQIALEGFDPVYGARPLKRAIQKETENPLATKLIEGAFREGEAIVVEVGGDGRFIFRHAPRVAAERETVAA